MKNLIHFLFFFLLANVAFSQAELTVGEDANPHDPSAIAEFKANGKGVLIPRLTTAQRDAIASPATGLLIYDTDLQAFGFYNGTGRCCIKNIRIRCENKILYCKQYK